MNKKSGRFFHSTFSTRERSARTAIPFVAFAALCATLAFSARDSRAENATPPNVVQQGSSADKILPVVIFTTWRVPREDAFTVSVPQGWHTSGGANRRSAVDITHTIRSTTADGRVKMFMNDADIIPHEVPNQMTNMAGQREGQTVQAAWGGPVLLARFQTGQQFAQTYVTQKLCPGATVCGRCGCGRASVGRRNLFSLRRRLRLRNGDYASRWPSRAGRRHVVCVADQRLHGEKRSGRFLRHVHPAHDEFQFQA